MRYYRCGEFCECDITVRAILDIKVVSFAASLCGTGGRGGEGYTPGMLRSSYVRSGEVLMDIVSYMGRQERGLGVGSGEFQVCVFIQPGCEACRAVNVR